jgi:molybdenum cofactor cytidylyltransferase
MPDTTVAGVVLAAGLSSRMGQNKLLLSLEGESLVRRAVRIAVEARLAPVVVVLGHEAERVRDELRGLECLPVLNPDYAKGAGASLRVGAARVATEAGALVVLLADMPFVTAAAIQAVVERYRSSGAPLVVSRYGDVEAPPTLYDRSLFPELLAIDDDRCGKPVVRRHRHEAAFVSSPAQALHDIDVAADYEHVRAHPAGA